jgi:hypothetical protein
MSLVLAIEPDRRQAAQLTAIVKRQVGADLVLADTTEHALQSIGNRVPDLVLVPALLSPRDDAALATALRVIATAAHVQMLTIPVLAASQARPARRGMFASLLGKPAPEEPVAEGCSPGVFAEQIASYLARAAEERKAVQQQQAFAHREADAAVEQPEIIQPFEEPAAQAWEPEPVPETWEPEPEHALLAAEQEPAALDHDVTRIEPAAMVVQPSESTDFEPVEADAEASVVQFEPVETESADHVEAVALEVHPDAVESEPWDEVVESDAPTSIALQQEDDEEDIELMPVLEPVSDTRPTPAIEAVAAAPVPAAEPSADKKAEADVSTAEFEGNEWRIADHPITPFEEAWRSWPPIEMDGTVRETAPVVEAPDATAMAAVAEPQAQPVIEEPEEELVSAAIITPQPRSMLAAPPRYEQTWAELIESLRSDLDRMKISGSQPASAAAAPAAVPDPSPAIASPKRAAKPKPAAKAEPIPRASRSKRRANAKAAAVDTQDEWGLFDPEKCGFGALLKKLDEITDTDKSTHRSA